MKKFKKLLAGLLSFAMLASMVPTAIAEDEYLYYQDFNDASSYSEYFNSAVSSWTSDVTDGNVTYTKVEATNYNSPVARTNPGVVNIALEAGVWYETGYKVKVESGSFQANAFGFLIGDNTQIANTSRGNIFKFKDASALAYSFGNIQDYVTVTTKFMIPDLGGSTVNVMATAEYVAKDGTEKTETYEYTAGKQTWNTTWKGFCFTDANSATGVVVSFDDVYLKKVPVLPESTVTFNANGGVCDVTELKTTTGEVAEPTATREGWEFDGWYVADADGNITDTEFDPKAVTESMTVIAKWTKIHTVTFDSMGGTEYEAMTTTTGTIDMTGKTPENVAKGAFIGWFYDDNGTETEFDGTGITGDMTVYAKYDTNLFNYTFDSEADVPDGFKSASGWTSAWDNGKMKYTISAASNTYTHAFDFYPSQPLAREQWYELGYTYDITQGDISRFIHNANIGQGGKSVVDILNMGIGSHAKIDGDVKISTQFKLSEAYRPEGATEDKLDITANMKAEYNVLSTDENGATVSTPTVKKFSTTIQQPNYRNSLYLFEVHGDPVKGDITFTLDDVYLKALEIEENYVVTFEPDGGECEVETMDTLGGEITGLMPTATKEGYHFDGWFVDADRNGAYTDGEVEFTGKDIKANLTAVAKWSKVYTVTFETYGGTAIDPIGTYTGAITLPSAPVKSGAGAFEGWFTDEAFTNAFDPTKVTADMTVYAKYGTKLFNYTFDSEADVPDGFKSTSSWVSTWENGKMKYTITGANRVYDNLFSAVISQSLAREQWYELGYTYSIPEGDISRFKQSVIIGAGGNSVINLIDDLGIGSHASIDGDVKITSLFKLSEAYRPEGATEDKLDLTINMKAEYYVDGELVTKKFSETVQQPNYRNNLYSATMNADPANGDITVLLDDFYLDIVEGSENYVVTFDANGGECATTTMDVLAGEITGLLPTPTMEGYHFDGWFVADESGNITDTAFTGKDITSNVTAIAKWSKIYTVTFETYGGTAIDPIETYTGTIALPSAPVKSGTGAFEGWFTDEAFTNAFDPTKVTGDMTVYAKYGTKLFNYTFDSEADVPDGFKSAEGSAWTSTWENGKMKYTISTTSNSFAHLFDFTPKQALARNQWYEFGYTYSMPEGNIGRFIHNAVIGAGGNTVISPLDMGITDYTKIDGDIKIKTMFKRGDVTGKDAYNNNLHDVQINMSAEYYVDGELVTKKISKTVSQWDSRNSFYSFEMHGDAAKGDITVLLDDVYLDIVEVEESYVVTFDANGGECATTTMDVLAGEITGLLPTPTKEGYHFDGWFVADGDGNITTTAFTGKDITSNVTAIAAWTKIHTVTFDSKGGTAIDPIETYTGEITLPADPVNKATGAFIGWFYMDGETEKAFDGKNITGDMTVYAKYSSYLFDYTFDEEADYIDGFKSADSSAWTSAWDSANEKLVYTITGASKDYSALFTYAPVLYFNDSSDAADPDWYEIGYTYSATSGAANSLSHTIRIGNGGVNIVNIGKIVTNSYDEIDGDIDVKILFKRTLNGNDDGYGRLLVDVQAVMTAEYTVGGVPVKNIYETTQANWFQAGRNNLYDITIKSNNISGDVTVTLDDVYYKKAEGVTSYNVTFNADGGTASYTSLEAINGQISSALPTATKEGFHFDGWFVDADENGVYTDGEVTFTGKETLTSDIQIVAKWTPIYTVTFDSDGGTAVAPISTYTGEITMPKAPVKAGVGILENWYIVENGTMTDKVFDGKNITSNLTVKAVYSNYIYKEFFDGATYDTNFDTVIEEEEANRRWQSEIVDGKIVYTLINPEAQATNSYAKIFSNTSYKTDIDTRTTYEAGYTVNFNGKGIPYGTMGIALGDKGISGMTTLAPIGGTASGQLIFAGKIIESSAADVDGDINVKLVFTVDKDGLNDLDGEVVENEDGTTSTVYKNQSNGTVTAYVNYFSNGQLKEHKVEYNFLSYNGQRKSEVCTFNGMALSENLSKSAPEDGYEITLDNVYVKIPEVNTITFNTNGGSDVAAMNVFAGIITEELPEPTKDGWTFAGWFRDAALTDQFGGSIVSGDTTLYARWQQAPKVVSTTPEDGGYAASRSPIITLTFDSEVDASTVANNVKLYDGDKAIPKSNYIVTSALNAERKTVVTLTVTGTLAFGTTYTVKASGITNIAGAMENEFTMDFVSERLEFGVENVTITDADATYNNVAEAKGKDVTVTFTVKNVAE